jgi:uncharacterized protein YegL
LSQCHDDSKIYKQLFPNEYRKTCGGDYVNKRNQQLIVAAILFVIALGLSYYSTQEKEVLKEADIMLVLDVSGSMGDEGQNGTKLDDAKESAIEFLNAVRPEFYIGLITFEDSVILRAPLSMDRNNLISHIEQMTEEGGTALGDAIALATDHLTSEGRSIADKYMVLMTDGMQTTLNRYDWPEAAEIASSENVVIYTVGFGSDAAVGDLESIARKTGGQYLFAASGSELVQSFVTIAKEISRNTGYYYGSRSLMVIAVFLIIFLPAVVKTGKMAVDTMKEKFMKV